MELRKIRGCTQADLDAKRFNIAVGISLGNKWFTLDNTIGLIKWSLEHTKEYVIVYVADSIHAINLEARNGMKPERAMKKAEEAGEKFVADIESEVHKVFSPEDVQKIFFARWSDLMTKDFLEKRDYLYSVYESDNEFKEYIHGIVRLFLSEEQRTFSQDAIHKLGTYIIEELPEIICRVPIKSMSYEANAYPFDSAITELAEKIQQGVLFPKIKENILDTEPRVFFEVR
jgi:tRNA-dependent cyclodipeptide synthase